MKVQNYKKKIIIMKRSFFVSISIFIIIVAIFAMSSCSQPSNPKAVVTVVGENGQAIEEARVVVRAPISDSASTMIYLEDTNKPVADTSYTDRNGQVFYSFKYEAIYRVEVTVWGTHANPLTRRGLGVLILENDKTYETSITVNTQTVF